MNYHSDQFDVTPAEFEEDKSVPIIVMDDNLKSDEPSELPLLYKKMKNVKSEEESTSLMQKLQNNVPSRRGKNVRPDIKSSLPASEVRSSLLTFADSTILTPDEFLVLVGWMPKHLRVCEFHLSFDFKKHGSPLDIVYSKCCGSDVCASFIIIETEEEGKVFGGFLNEPLKKSSIFYGVNESFVFSIRPDRVVYERKLRTSRTKDENNCSDTDSIKSDLEQMSCVLSDENEFIMGRNENDFAFRIDSGLRKCLYRSCTQFGNKSLAGHDNFLCANIEVWTVKPPPVIVPPPPQPVESKFNICRAFMTHSNDEIALTKRATTKSKGKNPSSLRFTVKSPVKKGTSNALNEWRSDAAVMIQSTWRRAMCKSKYHSVSTSVITIQRVWRGYWRRCRFSIPITHETETNNVLQAAVED